MKSRPALTAARLAGVTSIGLASLMLNPFFIAPVVGLAALFVRRRYRIRFTWRKPHDRGVEHSG